MADGIIQVAADSTGKKVDTSELTVGANTVERQRVILSGNTVAAALADVINSAPGSTDYGLVTRVVSTQTAPIFVKLTDGTNVLTFEQPSNDGEAATEFCLATEGYGMLYNGATFDRMRGDIANGVDVDVTRLPAGTNYIGKVRLTDGTNDLTLEQAVSDGEAGGDWAIPVECYAMVFNGTTWDRKRPDIHEYAFFAKTADFTTAQTGITLWTPTTGKKFVITDIVVSFSAAGSLTVFDGTDNTTLRVCKLNGAVNGGAVIPYRKPYISAAANNLLKYTTTAGAAGSITVSGYEI